MDDKKVLSIKFGGVAKDPRPDEPSMIYKKSDYPYQYGSECAHINTQISEELDTVLCRDCGEKLSPMWVLKRLANEETKWASKRAEMLKLGEELYKRKRCKCEKCGEITTIDRNSPIR